MALRHLSLRDFVIVPTLDLECQPGFTALTGETGAGKSILVDALQLVLGGRGDALWVREGQPRCDLSAEFDVPPATFDWLDEHGFDHSGALLLRRTIDSAGKSRAWINGSPATVAQLRELGESLVDIHGQHAWQSLTRPAAVRALLDAFAGTDTAVLTSAWQQWQAAEAALVNARQALHHSEQERERLLWQIGELDRLAPAPGEWPDLNQRHARLSNAQALIDAAHTAAAALEGDDGAAAALPALNDARQALQALHAIEPDFAGLIEMIDSAASQAREVAHSLHAYLRRAEADPDELARLDERMGQWVGLARRYRRPAEELPLVLQTWRDELAKLDASIDLRRLEADVEQTHKHYLDQAHAVSRLRADAAPRLANAITAAMQELAMQGGRFEVALEPLAQPAAHGLENVQFLVAAHAGGAPRAIDRVASGGELSRLALAIAVTTSALGSAGTLVFDEVDSGVGGAVASTVGRLLHSLGHTRQVLCVTHLPQVAAFADQHLRVSKSQDSGMAGPPTISSTVAPIAGQQRVDEIARMLGGERISETTLAHAREMLDAKTMVAPSPAPARARKVRAA